MSIQQVSRDTRALWLRWLAAAARARGARTQADQHLFGPASVVSARNKWAHDDDETNERLARGCTPRLAAE
jgi:hypothetical protein